MKIFSDSTLWAQKEYFGNSVENYLIALGVLIGLMIIFSLFQKYFLHRLERIAKKTKTELDDIVIKIVRTVRPPFYFFIAFYIAVRTLTFSSIVQGVIAAILIIWAVFIVTKAVQIFITYLFRERLKKESEASARSAIGAVNIIIKIFLWTFALLLVLSNLGINITSLIAGLGVGGIAIALALQNILSDLFSSFALYFDKPFVVGDYIELGKYKGTVEKIGIKTTRIRALQGEEIVISNQELTAAKVRNFKRMQERRTTFTIGVTYDTPTIKLKLISPEIKKIIDDTDNARFNRSHFKEFGDSALLFETTFYITSADYSECLDVQQKINFKVRELFEREKIEMAFPTQTVYIQK